MPLCHSGKISSGECNPYLRQRDSEPLMDGATGYTHATFDELAQYDVSAEQIEWLRRQAELSAVMYFNPLISQSRRETFLERRFGGHTPDTKRWRDGFCDPLNAGALYQNGALPTEAPVLEAVSLTMCQLNLAADHLEPRPLRIVTLEGARQMHSPSVSVVFPNASDVSFSILLEAQSLPEDIVFGQDLHTKECRELYEAKLQRHLENVNSLAVNIGPDAIASLKSKLEGIIKNSAIVSENYEADEMFHTSAVLILQDRSSVSFDKVRDIRMVANCEDETPVSLRTIILEHPQVERQRIELPVEDLLEIYSEVAEARGREGVPGLVENYGQQSDSQRAEDAQIGVFWQIKDPNEYMLWRETLGIFLANERRVASVYYGEDYEDERTQMRMLGHLTHLLMAAIFRSTYQVESGGIDIELPPE